MGGQSSRPIPAFGRWHLLYSDDMTFYPYDDLTIGYQSVSATEDNVRSQGQYVGLSVRQDKHIGSYGNGEFLEDTRYVNGIHFRVTATWGKMA